MQKGVRLITKVRTKRKLRWVGVRGGEEGDWRNVQSWQSVWGKSLQLSSSWQPACLLHDHRLPHPQHTLSNPTTLVGTFPVVLGGGGIRGMA